MVGDFDWLCGRLPPEMQRWVGRSPWLLYSTISINEFANMECWVTYSELRFGI